jgi:hypothetical protein
MINSEHLNISTFCPKKARFSPCLAKKLFMKAIKISTFPLIQAAFRSYERVKKKSDTSNTAFSRKSKIPG